MKVQEIEEQEYVSGRMPRCIDAEIQENLVDTVISGDIVIMNGILKTEQAQGWRKGGGGNYDKKE